MKLKTGALIAIEGVDGAGKHTQMEALRHELHLRGIETSTYSFPDYAGSHLGDTIKQMLAGKFGEATQINPFLSAPLFALERAEKRDAVLSDLRSGRVVLCDRYVYSNVAHQACRLPVRERELFREWLEHIEFGTLGLPRPELTLLLDVDDQAASRRRLLRASQPKSDRELDDYERDDRLLALARSIYLDLAHAFAWPIVQSTDRGRTLDRAEVTREVLRHVLPFIESCNDA